MKKNFTWLKTNYQFAVIAGILLITASAIIWNVFFKSELSGAKELAVIQSIVSKHILLPVDETPTLALVEDKAKLKDKNLAAVVENGDKVLVYATSKQVIVYRPKLDRIVAVLPLSIDQAAVEAEGASVTILNGTKDTNISAKIEQNIKTAYPNIKITKADANRRDFPTTLVIDNTNNKDYLQQSLIGILDAKQGIVPLSEDEASTEFMILVGADSLD